MIHYYHEIDQLRMAEENNKLLRSCQTYIEKRSGTMVEVIVDAGICGFKATIQIESEDMQMANIKIKTDCPNLKPMENELQEADGYAVCFSKLGDGIIYEYAKKYCRHPGCPVPAAIIKGIEVACGLALPNDATIKINKV